MNRKLVLWLPFALMAALLHDAPEYVIGDMISPVKSAVGPDRKSTRLNSSH